MSTAPDLTYVTIDTDDGNEESALYKRDHLGDWAFVTSEIGPDTHSALDTIKTLGQSYRTTRLITHLRVGGVWQQIVPDHLMQESTPVQRLMTEIANLRADAARREESAGYSGSHSDGGASTLRTRADGIEHALSVLTADND